MKAVLFDFTGVIANVRAALIGESGPDYVIEPVQVVIEAIPALRTAGLKTCLVSNNDREALLAAATNIDFDALFDELVFSSDVGVNKPHPRIFLHALDRLDCDAAECLFIDDIARNVDSAIELGMAGLVAERPEKVVAALKELGA